MEIESALSLTVGQRPGRLQSSTITLDAIATFQGCVQAGDRFTHALKMRWRSANREQIHPVRSHIPAPCRGLVTPILQPICSPLAAVLSARCRPICTSNSMPAPPPALKCQPGFARGALVKLPSRTPSRFEIAANDPFGLVQRPDGVLPGRRATGDRAGHRDGSNPARDHRGGIRGTAGPTRSHRRAGRVLLVGRWGHAASRTRDAPRLVAATPSRLLPPWSRPRCPRSRS